MSKSSLDPTALAATLIAAAAAALLVPAGLAWLGSIAGLVLLLILLAYDEEGYRSLLQSLAFAGSCALCLTVASIIPYQYVYGLPSAREPQLTEKWLPLTCGFTTLLFWVIDRARMGARSNKVQPGAAAVGSMFSARTPVAAETYTAAPSSTEPRLVRDDMHPVPQPPVVQPVPAAAPTAAPPAALTEIYVHITGEGMNLMRSVQAEPLGRDYYRIVDTMPENETWEFAPGQVVRCKKQNLSTGKAMVAVEEAPRAK